MDAQAQQPSATATQPTPAPRPAHQKPRPRGDNIGGPLDEPDNSSHSGQRGGRGRGQRRPQGQGRGTQGRQGASDASDIAEAGRPNRTADSRQPRRRPPRPHDGKPSAAVTGGPDQQKGPIKRSARAPRFNAGLTEDKPPSSPPEKRQPRRGGATTQGRAPPTRDDLTSTLTYELSTPPYPDCLICFAAIRPFEPTFSCSPNIPIASAATASDDEDGSRTVAPQCCWTTFHLKCIKAWASKNVKDTEAAWRARGEEREGAWRCPGCQAKRSVVPAVYSCFCGAVVDPRPPRLATPHSCANTCTRRRACGHACPLPCHPGPCPPCQVTTQTACFCGKKILTFRCGNLAQSRAVLSCAQLCERPLRCGNHRCEQPCHDGPCAPCPITETAKCYCGKVDQQLACGEGEGKMSIINDNGTEQRWIGRFECGRTCDRLFDCGIHHCSLPCHVPSPLPAPCPRSPAVVSTCPCGKHTLDSTSAAFFSPSAVLARSACTDPIPTCTSPCAKSLPGCSHTCVHKCHLGPCPPCAVNLLRPCRCGSTNTSVTCSADQARAKGELGEILCDKACTALRACGRHQCNRVCCPLASLATASKGKGKKRATEQDDIVDDAGWHTCDLICGKQLPCGNHTCEEADHRGPCPSCLRSSFEEMVCHCGQTVLEPPIPCGTRIVCRFPCSRPPPPCGHPKTQHACHEDPAPCPPCPFLTEKECACGKKMMPNTRCSQEKVSCGSACGKLLACGFHQCERLCHGDDCGPCHAVCGKPRKLCLPASHPCTQPCHAPAACIETEPCRATVTLSCPCGRIRQPVPCGRSVVNPHGREGSQQLKCTNECLVAKRNARLAEALGINLEAKSQQVAYTDELIAFAKANAKFCQLVEKTFHDFVSSDKKSQILPHMPEPRRNFVHNLASMYRLDTQMVDQEPHRSVQLIRRMDSRVPAPLLSTASSTSSVAPASLGRLTPLRAPIAQRPSPVPSRFAAATASSSSTTSGARGWTAIVATPPSSRVSPAPSPTAWLKEARPAPVPAPARTPAANVVASTAALSLEADVPDDWEDDV